MARPKAVVDPNAPVVPKKTRATRATSAPKANEAEIAPVFASPIIGDDETEDSDNGFTTAVAGDFVDQDGNVVDVEDDEDADAEEPDVPAQRETDIEAVQRELAELRKAVLGEDSVMAPRQKRVPEVFIRFFEEEDGKFPIVFFNDSKVKGDQLFANFMIVKNGKEEARIYDQVKLINEMPRYHAQIIKERWTRVPRHQGAHPTYVTQVQQDPYNDNLANIQFQPRKIKLEEMYATCVVTVRFTEGPLKGQQLKIQSIGNALNG